MPCICDIILVSMVMGIFISNGSECLMMSLIVARCLIVLGWTHWTTDFLAFGILLHPNGGSRRTNSAKYEQIRSNPASRCLACASSRLVSSHLALKRAFIETRFIHYKTSSRAERRDHVKM